MAMRIPLLRSAALAAGLILTALVVSQTAPAGGSDAAAEAVPDPGAARSLPAVAPVRLADANPCNPCAGKANPCNPCGKQANPCGMKRNPCNPCGKQTNPCGMKRNPCNPCGGSRVDPSRFKQPSGAKLASGSHSELTALGEKLWNWNDRTLGSSGIACSTCHVGGTGQMNDSFDAPYPHYVEMPAQQAGVRQVSAAEMVNFCMIVPMQDEPLPWESRELAALSAYVEKLQVGFQPGAGAGRELSEAPLAAGGGAR
jgi:hypothetical protein